MFTTPLVRIVRDAPVVDTAIAEVYESDTERSYIYGGVGGDRYRGGTDNDTLP
jgi:hypothetical protein